MARRMPAHRLTTAHLQSLYPFVAEGGLGGRGVYIGRDLFGSSFVYDPWVLYERGLLTSPNMLVAGQIGRGKSAFVKSWLWRSSVFGRRGVVLDPKGEYAPLARAFGVEPIKLHPRGRLRLNPLDERVAHEDQERLLQAITSAALARALHPQEKTALSMALRDSRDKCAGEATLPQVVDSLLHPCARASSTVAADPLAVLEWGREVAFELRRLVVGDLQGMFDGPTSEDVDLSAPIVVLDLSAVYSSDALGILMACAAAWLTGVLANVSTGKTIFVLDEAWAILANLGIAKWLQANFKLSRAYGIQNVAVIHRFSDLAAVGAQGSQEERVARGLLSDAETRVVYGQSEAEVTATRDLLGLSDTEVALLPQLDRGVALWKVGQRSFLVNHWLGAMERDIVDTDARMVLETRDPVEVAQL